jgi:hypothetical protein
MNCHEFENVVVDLVRGAVADSSLGTRCWAHAANCPWCAERLLAQEKLTAGLEALTTCTDAMQAPERFEARLRDQFRAQFARNDGHTAERPTKLVMPKLSWINPRGWVWAEAAAVLLLSLAGLMAIMHRTELPVTTAQNVTVAKGTALHTTVGTKNALVPAVSQKESTTGRPGANSVSKSRKNRTGKKNSKTPAIPTFRSTAKDELATNFYPLPYGSGLPLDDGWEIVRVSLPRSALATLGVPVAGELTSTAPIKADIVVGGDGLARAIRFVE